MVRWLFSGVKELSMNSDYNTLTGKQPAIIAHRGASGYLPEHTLEAYTLAIDLGCDFIEPDLVFTKDGHIVVRHDGHLSPSTDVAERPEFKKRRKFSKAFGFEDWFVEDFTLEEIKSLRARQAFSGRSKEYDSKFLIPTFEEVLDLARAKSKEKARPIGVYPETKHPRYYKSLGHDFTNPLLSALTSYGFDQEGSRVFIQSFEPMILLRLARITKLPLILLLKENFKGKFLLSVIARYATGIGPAKELLVKNGVSTGLLEKAHEKGLLVHPYTFRNDSIGPGFTNIEEELEFFFKLGVDAVFTDFTDTARAVRQRLKPA